MFFDQLQDLIQIGSNVLLDDGNEETQLLEEELLEGDISQSHNVDKARDNLDDNVSRVISPFLLSIQFNSIQFNSIQFNSIQPV